ncbi:hypothetical protein [Streptomyces sp.]|uniref:hypothetical protein n=1 Tax=Streptomyces sp. TaxID=1931 RepID=UPI002F91EC71
MDDVRSVPENALTCGGRSRDEVAEAEPEPVGAIAERVLDDLAARRREALNRLARQKPAIRRSQP